MKLATLFSNDCDNTWVSHIVFSLCRQIHENQPEADVALVVHTFPPEMEGHAFLFQAIPRIWHRPVYWLDRGNRILRWAHARRFERELADSDIVYFWPDTPLRLYDQAKARGLKIVHEMINTHLVTVQEILDVEYHRAGLRPPHGITDAKIAVESERLDRADLVFAPSPLVGQSLRSNGVESSKVFETSYGWCPNRIGVPKTASRTSSSTTVCFVGRLCLRKGVYYLLQAWRRAAIDGKLVFCGTVSDEVRLVCGEDLKQDNIVCLGHVRDVSTVLDQADVFVLPALEEGSPLATYEAMAKGLGILVSPMGGGGVVRDGVDGFILDPLDIDAWVAALRRLAADAGLRNSLGESAAVRAREFTWQKVAGRRYERMLELLD